MKQQILVWGMWMKNNKQSNSVKLLQCNRRLKIARNKVKRLARNKHVAMLDRHITMATKQELGIY